MLKDLVNTGFIDYVAMDIKAPKDKYSIVFSDHSNIEDIEESISFLKSGRVDYEFRTTCVPGVHQRDDFAKMADWIKGAKKYYLQKFIPTKILNPQFLKKTTYNDEEFKVFQKILQPHVDFCGIR